MPVDLSFDPSIPVAEAKSETDELIYRISHDLRASVRALQELPAWVIEDIDAARIALPASTARHLELISSHACRMDLMLTGLLEFSRIGRMQAIAPIKPAHVVQEVIDDLGPPATASLLVEVDRGSVQMGDTDLARVFHILLSNALRFNDNPKPHVAVTGGPTSGNKWVISVTDNGTGIPEDKRDYVQRPMTKLVSRDADSGAGMGLAILKKIAWSYGGEVAISTPKSGVGTRVDISLAVN
ncbi:MAG: HAMP domain-containing sensor histidine kinase [Pseudomonadota bacterium]